jgi:hypothetical protein
MLQQRARPEVGSNTVVMDETRVDDLQQIYHKRNGQDDEVPVGAPPFSPNIHCPKYDPQFLCHIAKTDRWEGK